MEGALHSILHYFSHSTQRKEALHRLQEACNVRQLNMVRMALTRWLSRGETL